MIGRPVLTICRRYEAAIQNRNYWCGNTYMQKALATHYSKRNSRNNFFFIDCFTALLKEAIVPKALYLITNPPFADTIF